MLKDYSAIIGVGQCGGNIVSEFELNDFDCFYINTSLEDLDTVVKDNRDNNYFHIRNTKGMAKDRIMALNVITNNEGEMADLVAETIYKKYANPKMYFFVCSASGGTGGAMTIPIMKSFKEMYPEKMINVIVALPHAAEDMIMHYNAFEFLKELKKAYDLRIINNIQILDNNKRDFGKKSSINKIISSLMNTLFSFQGVTKEGNLDEQEFEEIFCARGLTIMHEFANKDFANEISKIEEETIYNKVLHRPFLHGYIFNKDNYDENTKRIIQDTFGVPKKSHETFWEEEEGIVVSTGIDFTNDIFKFISKPLMDNYNALKERKDKLENEMLEQLADLDSFDVDSVTFEGINSNRVEEFKPENTTKRRRGRGVGLKAEMSRIR